MKSKKIILTLVQKYYWLLEKISLPYFKKKYPLFLKKRGINISSDFYSEFGDAYIHPSCHFDGKDYSLITIGNNTTISKNVEILTHDYSISKAMIKMGNYNKGGFFLKEVKIGKNCFIGANVIILPGTKIGDNVIIGAGSVVKGNIEKNQVMAGNPLRAIMTIEEFYEIHEDRKDYLIYDYKSGDGEIIAK
ncbi:acyltransferase [Enterococcus avium]|jgi:acetyltransferase-like isoleucine patch superfamily enzyme|uniref:acyltransferase n=1 Tax=Enterococcus avium TaxID=33945 RepID=UPI001D098C44|nr:acyltransferase [Enterococcus avium]MCB6918479.1 acyltransferase [Enterococcus avium]MCQ4962581.1 acyltransferase [Enterococcus avium]